jgi:hypothetical protein
MVLFNQAPEPTRDPPLGTGPKPAGGKSAVWGWLLLALMAILVFFFVRAFRRFGTEVAHLSRQTEEMNGRLTEIEQ